MFVVHEQHMLNTREKEPEGHKTAETLKCVSVLAVFHF